MDMQKEKEAFANWFGACFTNGKIEFDADGVPIGYEKAIAWKAWKAAKAHEAKKLEGCVVVPESELKDTFYWPDSEYVVDCPFDYDFELDKGEIQAIEKWQRTKSTKIYFANIYKDDESFEITEFKSLEEAQDAVKENNAYLEAQEFFNLSEAARGGNE